MATGFRIGDEIDFNSDPEDGINYNHNYHGKIININEVRKLITIQRRDNHQYFTYFSDEITIYTNNDISLDLPPGPMSMEQQGTADLDHDYFDRSKPNIITITKDNENESNIQFDFKNKQVIIGNRKFRPDDIKTTKKHHEGVSVTDTNNNTYHLNFTSTPKTQYIYSKLSTFMRLKSDYNINQDIPKILYVQSMVKPKVNIETVNDRCQLHKCIHLVRVLEVMKHQQQVLMHADESALMEYCASNKSLLDDWTHVIMQHSTELDEIFYEVIPKHDVVDACPMGDQCPMSKRHLRDRKKDVDKHGFENRDEYELIFYTDLLDQMHCYLYHLWDYGFRSRKHEHDHGQNTVIDIMISNKYQISDDMDGSKDDITFMDTFYQKLQSMNLGGVIKQLQEEQYDTESLQMDDAEI